MSVDVDHIALGGRGGGASAGLALAGGDLGIPIVALQGAKVTYFGPVLSPAPTGADAVDLWDTFVSLMRYDGIYEIKRSRRGRPQLGPRPLV